MAKFEISQRAQGTGSGVPFHTDKRLISFLLQSKSMSQQEENLQVHKNVICINGASPANQWLEVLKNIK